MNSLEFQKIIETDIKSGKILHSYMFYGEKIEKYNQQILLFLYSIIKERDIFKEYNNNYSVIEKEERLYNQIMSGVIEEFKILDGKEMKVQDIRESFSTVYEKPLIIPKRIYVIHNFEYLNNNSQNALLKILEEPPKYVTIVLTAKTLNNILDTIKSRCQKIYLAEKLDKKQIHDNQEENIKEYSEKVKNDILNILENTKILKKTQFYAKYSDILTKDNILEILDVLEDIIYENILLYNDMYKIIVEARRRIKINCNFEMTKDYLILNIWDKSNIERK